MSHLFPPLLLAGSLAKCRPRGFGLWSLVRHRLGESRRRRRKPAISGIISRVEGLIIIADWRSLCFVV